VFSPLFWARHCENGNDRFQKPRPAGYGRLRRFNLLGLYGRFVPSPALAEQYGDRQVMADKRRPVSADLQWYSDLRIGLGDLADSKNVGAGGTAILP
jgi:hypothetical protein